MDEFERSAIWFAVAGALTALMLSGCSYGTYNATGSYPHQDNHTEECKKG